MLYLQQIAGIDEEIASGSCRSATVTSASYISAAFAMDESWEFFEKVLFGLTSECSGSRPLRSRPAGLPRACVHRLTRSGTCDASNRAMLDFRRVRDPVGYRARRKSYRNREVKP